MRIQLLSDLHLESEAFEPMPHPEAELLVLAGDIDATWRGYERFAGWPVPVLAVAGNHEFDGRELDAAWPALHEHCARYGITLLERDSRVLTAQDGRRIRFLGTVRWCDFDGLGAAQRVRAMRAGAYFQRVMRATKGGLPFDADAVRRAALACRSWLSEALAEPAEDRWDTTVAITHFAPSLRSVDPRYGLMPSTASRASRVPVLNMQCDIYHPFQCLADLMTIIEKKGRDLRRKKMVVSWAYAASYQKPMSVPQSLILQMPRFGMDVVLAHPPEFKLMPDIMDQAQQLARAAGAGFEVMDDMEAAFKDADIIYAKSWGAVVHTPDPEEGAWIIKKYAHWITDERKMALAKPDAIYMHPLPADRNIEVTDAVMDGPSSVVYDQAENRLHAQKAVMALTMR